MNAAIIAFYMSNIPREMLELHAKVNQKFNQKNYKFFYIQTQSDHGSSMDFVMNACIDPKNDITQKLGSPDVVMFMDIDCIPLHPAAMDEYILTAKQGNIVGNAQRSNHIQNNQHIYAGSPAVALSIDTFLKIGKPSARPTARGDVAEEWTFKAEEAGVPVALIMPKRFDAPPFRMAWETDTRPYWPLKDEQPEYHYGIGTTYGFPVGGEDMVWHMFQSFHEGQFDRFKTKCEEVLTMGKDLVKVNGE